MSNNILDSLVAGRERAVSAPSRKTKPGVVFAPSLCCPRCELLSATRRPVEMPDGHYWTVCPTCEEEVKALPKERLTLAEQLVIDAILRQFKAECALALPPGPIAVAMPVPEPVNEVARQREKRSADKVKRAMGKPTGKSKQAKQKQKRRAAEAARKRNRRIA